MIYIFYTHRPCYVRTVLALILIPRRPTGPFVLSPLYRSGGGYDCEKPAFDRQSDLPHLDSSLHLSPLEYLTCQGIPATDPVVL